MSPAAAAVVVVMHVVAIVAARALERRLRKTWTPVRHARALAERAATRR